MLNTNNFFIKKGNTHAYTKNCLVVRCKVTQYEHCHETPFNFFFIQQTHLPPYYQAEIYVRIWFQFRGDHRESRKLHAVLSEITILYQLYGLLPDAVQCVCIAVVLRGSAGLHYRRFIRALTLIQ